MNVDSLIPRSIKAEAKTRLRRIENEQDVRILLAVESGSRAWGFPSKDSDYDIRFIYIHRADWYLSIESDRHRDVIELPITDDLDINGWDIRKALVLFSKSNPPLLEWLSSPLKYIESGPFARRLRRELGEFLNPSAGLHHYLHMARGNYRDYLRGEEVWIKKYFYVLRPLLAIRWIEQGRGHVPMLFVDLLETISDQPDLVSEVETLRARKMAGEELRKGPVIPGISGFIEAELKRLEDLRVRRPVRAPDLKPLDQLFLRTLEETWSHQEAG